MFILAFCNEQNISDENRSHFHCIHNLLKAILITPIINDAIMA